jgi:hypothetical protein
MKGQQIEIKKKSRFDIHIVLFGVLDLYKFIISHYIKDLLLF